LPDTAGAALAPKQRKQRKLSAAGRAAISAAVRARWDKVRAAGAKPKAAPAAAAKPKRKFSAAGKARLSALAKERWKKAKAAGKARL